MNYSPPDNNRLRHLPMPCWTAHRSRTWASVLLHSLAILLTSVFVRS